jgi:hypothetical protein
MAHDKTAFWSGHLAAQADSGLTQKAYCQAHGLARKSFGHWKRRLSAEPPAPAPPTWLPVTVAAEPPVGAAAIVVRLGDGLSIELPTDFDAATLSRLLSVMRP